MNESVRMIVVLSVIAMVSAGVLSWAYQTASVIIEENEARALESSVLEVLPGTSTVNIIRRSPDELGVEDPGEMKEREQKTTLIYQGVDAQGKIVGYAFVGEGNGYGGVVRVLVGVDEDTDQILNVKILSHTETPGLGSRIEDEGFRSQFAGKTAQDPIAINQDIDNLSGATISARATAEAVRKGLQDAVAIYRGGE
ncbi:MAG TPA: RnfABCDGE type electron transport complex subunit G [Firmicutes bacterium]|nr:RnfABCDGE type electron transport complex subunit G [Bacillota bacterium]HHT43662.1 RnfABCDGE type electron transport complex subunit G [Bacillota bacterium]